MNLALIAKLPAAKSGANILYTRMEFLYPLYPYNRSVSKLLSRHIIVSVTKVFTMCQALQGDVDYDG